MKLRLPRPRAGARSEVDALLHAASWGLEQPQRATGNEGPRPG